MGEPSRDGSLSHDGYGRSYTVQDLQLQRVFTLKQRLQELKPELFKDGVAALKAKRDAELAVAAVQREVHILLGGDAVLDMMKVFAEFAAAEQAIVSKPKRK